MPWKLNTDYNPNVVDETGTVICTIHGYGTPEGQWNARLICAAPEMYSLLKSALPYVPISSSKLRIRIQEILARIDKEDAA